MTLSSPAGFEGFLFSPQVHCFRFSGRLHLDGLGKCGLLFRIDPAQEAVRQALEMYRKLREASFALLGPKGQLTFDALEVLTAVQALNQARVQYLQQVVEFNRSQFRLFAVLGQPAYCGIDAVAPQSVSVPVVPAKPGPTPMALPNPRPVP